jgi:DNA-binding NarL/FixJ family response regulator
LTVSRRTVEKQIQTVYRKLGVGLEQTRSLLLAPSFETDVASAASAG